MPKNAAMFTSRVARAFRGSSVAVFQLHVAYTLRNPVNEVFTLHVACALYTVMHQISARAAPGHLSNCLSFRVGAYARGGCLFEGALIRGGAYSRGALDRSTTVYVFLMLSYCLKLEC